MREGRGKEERRGCRKQTLEFSQLKTELEGVVSLLLGLLHAGPLFIELLGLHPLGGSVLGLAGSGQLLVDALVDFNQISQGLLPGN